MGVFVRTQRFRPHLSADYASMAINFPFWGSKVNLNFTLFHRRLAYGLIYTGPPFPLWERKLSFTLIWGTQFSTYILHLRERFLREQSSPPLERAASQKL